MAVLATALICFIIQVRRDLILDGEVIAALQSTNQFGEITAQGKEALIRVNRRAIPVLLRLSEGKDPKWYKMADPVRRLFKVPPLKSAIWLKRETARRGFFALRAHAAPAVPGLLNRLSDTDPRVRRFTVQMLGSIGPAMGEKAFQQFTNCLTDPTQDVRNDVLWTIQFHRPEEYPVETLLNIYASGLTDPYWLSRQNAMNGLLKMGKKALPVRSKIEKALNDSDSSVRMLAQMVLKEFERR